ncbi:hypothetical protein Z043_102098 [Scleropages formosus]|uniref:adenylate cyclase n=1 Tax=Scleropages formosus TaxID=113540 RepID=A0A0P7VWA1_SCLFO|nr:hypothetical protein Z043_102098 [Scleropages formosus]
MEDFSQAFHLEPKNAEDKDGNTCLAEQACNMMQCVYFSQGLKTYLISGRKTDPSQCSCSQLGLAGLDLGDVRSPSPLAHTPDAPPATSTEATLQDTLSKSEPPCVSCTVMLLPGEDKSQETGAVLNGCREEDKSNSSKASGRSCRPKHLIVLTVFPFRSSVPPGRSLKALNGLLSPHLGPALANSQTSLCEMLQEKEKKWGGGGEVVGTMDHSALIPLRSKNFRERSDAHFVDVIKEDSLMKDYFFKPPINRLSLSFLEKSLESAYRTSYQEEVETQAAVRTFASPTFSSFLDVLLSCAVFLALTLACFLRPLLTDEPLPLPALCLAAVASLFEALSLVLSIRMAFCLDTVLGCTHTLLRAISGWVPRHLIGAVLVSLPALSIFSHVTCNLHLSIQFTMFMCCAVIIAIIQYCNFCQLSFWMRSILATTVGVVLLVLLYNPFCKMGSSDQRNVSRSVEHPSEPVPRPQDLLGPEAILAFFLLLLLVWFLNREFEVSYRLHYHGNVEADQHRIKIQNMRDQADWLLRNIIPIHVAEQLKVTQSYSKNHDNVAVIFASIVNFSEFYEESYEGGKECYRVLNELIGDFDELLRKPAFSSIEKIKTIGATYMAASGLSTQQGSDQAHPHGHLRALFEFALEMMRVVDDFNKNMLGFKFKLRIGFNHGPLTAGVIGTTKLLYDIWGDTVNIASRMDTTGVECRVQVSEESYCALNEMDYEFDYRGTVNVKGKGQMKTFLFPKSTDSGPVPQYQLSVSPEIRAQVDGSIGRSPTDEIGNMVPSATGPGHECQTFKAAKKTEDGGDALGVPKAQETASTIGVGSLPAPGAGMTQVSPGRHAQQGPSATAPVPDSALTSLLQVGKEEDDEADELTKL